MKICTPQLGIAPQSVLGGEVYDRQTITEFLRLKIQVNVLLPKNKPFNKFKNLKVKYAPLRHIVPPHLFNLFIVPYVIKLVKQNKVDLLRIHVPEFFGFSTWIIKKLKPQLPIVGHYHLDEAGFMFNFINHLFLNSHDLIISDSHYLKKQIINKYSLKPSKIKVVHCGTDTKTLSPGKKDQQLIKKYDLQNCVVILYLGLFIKRKNPHFLIKVFSKIHKSHPNTKLIMIGKGPEEKNLITLVQNLNISRNVIFPGPQYGKNKLRFYRTVDMFAFPSHNEGFALSVLEAMSCGLPLLVPNSVSFPEAVKNNFNGLLLKPNNQSDWHAKTSILIKNKRLRHKMAKNARSHAIKYFSWKMCAQNNLKAYKSILK